MDGPNQQISAGIALREGVIRLQRAFVPGENLLANTPAGVGSRSEKAHARRRSEVREREDVADLRLALLTNSLSPHSLPVCEHISRCVREFRAFLSSDSDRYHNLPRPEATFRITVQRSFNRLRLPRKAYGYWQRSELHIPYDTYAQLRSYNPDVILSVQLGVRTALAALYRLHRPHVKLILWATLSQHTEERRNWMRRCLRLWVIRHVDGAFVNGTQGESYLRLLGYKGQVATIPYAIDEASFRSESYQPQKGIFRLIYAGRLVPQKGIGDFCSVLRRWCADHPDVVVQLQLAGQGPEKRAIDALPTGPNLAISTLGALSQEELALQYHQADLFVFPTLGDEWGVVVNEAMTAGLPVLGSIYSQAVTELIEDGVSGWLFDARDRDSMYGAFDRAFGTNVDQLQAMSLHVKETIANLRPAAVADRAVDAMQRMCSGREGSVG